MIPEMQIHFDKLQAILKNQRDRILNKHIATMKNF
jgi:hypothetical protein